MTTALSGAKVPPEKCPQCGFSGDLLYEDLVDRFFDTPGSWSFLRCRSCRLLWLHPAPAGQEPEKLPAEYFTHNLDSGRAKGKRPPGKIKRALWAAHYGYPQQSLGVGTLRLGRILGFLPWLKDWAGRYILWLPREPSGRLLEIGSGNGEYLRRLVDLGWDALGIEPDAAAARIAREMFGVEVITGTLEEAGLAEDSFQAIVMNHVIEHVPDPFGLLRECRRLLQPGGRLVIVTPNPTGLAHTLFKKSWANLDPPRHRHIFSPESLRAAAERAGFEAIHASSKTRHHFTSWTWTASRRIRKKGRFRGQERARLLPTAGPLFYLIEEALRPLWKNAGEEYFLMATTK